MNIPMLDLKLEYEYMKEDIDSAIQQCLDHQKWILGAEVKELEDKIADYIGVKHCIGICSGTDALVLSLRALAINTKGQEYFDRTDEIITTPFTFTATGDAILRAGATPVFVDIDPTTYNIDPVKIKEYLRNYEDTKMVRSELSSSQIQNFSTSNSNIVGILPVHLYGQSCQMDEIMQIAEEHNFFVVEDVAQAFGGTWQGKKLGCIGSTGIFSFFPSKNLGGFGDGGMVATNDDEIAELIRMLLRHGGKDKYNVDHIGYNARLDTLQAAILLAKFKYLDEFNERRQKIAEFYTGELSGIDNLTLPLKDSTSQPLNFSTFEFFEGHVFHQYTIRTSRRNELQGYLKDKGISTMVYYPFPLHKMKVFGDNRSKIYNELIEAERAVSEVLSLPIEPLMNDDETNLVVKIISELYERQI